MITAISQAHTDVSDSISINASISLDDQGNEDDSRVLPAPPSPLVGVVIASSGIVAFAAVLGYHEPLRFSFLTLLIPLYTRLKKDDLETLQNRKEILGFIKGRPGANYTSIMHSLEIGNGTLTYHLKVLEENRLVKSRTDANLKRYYPHGHQIKEKVDRVIEILKQNPGLSQKDIVAILRMSRRKTARKLAELVESGLVRIEKEGRENHYFLVKENIGDPATAPRSITEPDT